VLCSTATATPAATGQLADTLDRVIAKIDGGRDGPEQPAGLLSSSDGEGGRAAERF
jgi:hypothetical protein